MAVQKRVLYSGNVQGVGFRWTAVHIARRHKVGGWVKNLPDGNVELIAEGEPEEVDLFLEEVREAMKGYIRRETVQEAPSQGYRDFTIRY